MSIIQIGATVGYLVLTSAIGILAGRIGGKGGVREFFVAQGQLSWLLVTPLLMAQFVTTTAAVGTAEMAHESGVVALMFFIGYPIAAIIMVLGLARFYTSIKKITIGEAFAVLFDRKTRLACVVLVLGTTALMVPVAFLGVGAILAPMLNISYQAAVWLSAAIMLVIAVLGGLRGIAWMNVVHTVVLIAAFIPVTVVSVNAAGGLNHMLAAVPPEYLNWVRPGGLTIAAWLIGSGLSQLVSTSAVTGMFAAKDEKNANISILSSGIFLVAFCVMPTLIGLSALVLMPNINSRDALWEMGELGGVTISTLVSVGVLAAVISSTPSFVLTMGGIATRDIFLLVKPAASEKSQMFFSRIAMLVLVVGGTLFALAQPSMLGTLLSISQVRAILAIVLIVSVFWRRIHPLAAFWSSVIGALTGFIWLFVGSPFGIEPLWPSFAVGILVLIILSLIKRPSPYKAAEGIDLNQQG